MSESKLHHTHITQGVTPGCPACESIRPESQTHPNLVPPLPVMESPTLTGDEAEPETPAHVEALSMATHRIVDERARCDGGRESRCHWWPDSAVCDHEEFPCGHEYVFHESCWIIEWLEAGDLGDTAEDSAWDERIDADEPRWPNGVIAHEWHGDYLTWSYVRIDTDPEPRTPVDGRRESDVPLWDEEVPSV